MKKLFCVIITSLVLGACGQEKEEGVNTAVTSSKPDSSVITNAVADTLMPEEEYNMDDQYANFYVVITDTGRNYYELDDKMYALSKAAKFDIDTMNRYYNKDKKKIIVPENDEDEMYRGEYYPRRFGASHLSVEYLDIFDENAGEGTMALVGCISETKREADSILAILKPQAPKGYVRLSRLYVGCMH